MLCPLRAMDVLKLLASVNVGGCHSEIKASLCTFPYPAECQASSSFLATRGSPPFSPLSLLIRVMPWSAYRMAERRESAPFCLSIAEVAPTSYRLTERGRGRAAAGGVCLSGGCCLPLCLDGQTTRGKRLCAGSRRTTKLTLLCS